MECAPHDTLMHCGVESCPIILYRFLRSQVSGLIITKLLYFCFLLFKVVGRLPRLFSLGAVKFIWQLWFMTRHRHRAPAGGWGGGWGSVVRGECMFECVWKCVNIMWVCGSMPGSRRTTAAVCSMFKHLTERTGKELLKKISMSRFSYCTTMRLRAETHRHQEE